MSEQHLINEIIGNPGRFAEIYNTHYSRIFNYCFRRTGDFEISKDITSETFLKAYLNIRKFKWKGVSISSWLYRIACNEINMYFRSKNYKARRMADIYGDVPASLNPSSLATEKALAESELNRNQLFVKVQLALKKLPVKYQEVISLKYFEQLTISEISGVLNKKNSTVKSLLSRGIAKLRNIL